MNYTIGKAEIIESFDLDKAGNVIRVMDISKSPHDLAVRLSNEGPEVEFVTEKSIEVRPSGGFIVATIPAASTPPPGQVRHRERSEY